MALDGAANSGLADWVIATLPVLPASATEHGPPPSHSTIAGAGDTALCTLTDTVPTHRWWGSNRMHDAVLRAGENGLTRGRADPITTHMDAVARAGDAVL